MAVEHPGFEIVFSNELFKYVIIQPLSWRRSPSQERGEEQQAKAFAYRPGTASAATPATKPLARLRRRCNRRLGKRSQ